MRIRDIMTKEEHDLDDGTPCLTWEHDRVSSTPNAYGADEGEARAPAPDATETVPLRSWAVGSLPYIWDETTRSYWVSEVLAPEAAHG